MAPRLRSARRPGYMPTEERAEPSVPSDQHEKSTPAARTVSMTVPSPLPQLQSPQTSHKGQTRGPSEAKPTESTASPSHSPAVLTAAKGTPKSSIKVAGASDGASQFVGVNPNSLSPEGIANYLSLIRGINEQNPSPGQSLQTAIDEALASIPSDYRKSVVDAVARHAPLFAHAAPWIHRLREQTKEYGQHLGRPYDPQSPNVLDLDPGKPLNIQDTPRPLHRPRHRRRNQHEMRELEHTPKPRKPAMRNKNKDQDWAQANKNRTQRGMDELDCAWGGRGWVPPYSRRQHGSDVLVPITAESLSSRDIANLSSVTAFAVDKRIPLPSLFQAGGAIHDAVLNCNRKSNQKPPVWTYEVSQIALSYIREARSPGDTFKANKNLQIDVKGENEDDCPTTLANVASPEGAFVGNDGNVVDESEAAEPPKCDLVHSQYSEDDSQSIGDDHHRNLDPSTPEVGRKMEMRSGFDGVLDDSPDIDVGGKSFPATFGASDSVLSSPLPAESKTHSRQRSKITSRRGTKFATVLADNESDNDGDRSEHTHDDTEFNLSLGSQDMELSFTPKEIVATEIIGHSDDDDSHLDNDGDEVLVTRRATSALLQLSSCDSWLTDDTIEITQRAIQQHFGSESIKEIDILDPLYLQIDSCSPKELPSLPRNRTPTHFLCCLHHQHPKHWTLLIVDAVRRQLLWYDPLPDSSRTEKAGERLLHWANTNLPAKETFNFSKLDGPQQPDGHSCGIFVLEALFYWIRDRTLPSKLDAREARRHLATFISQPSKSARRSPTQLQRTPETKSFSPLPASASPSPPIDLRRPLSQHRHKPEQSGQEAETHGHNDREPGLSYRSMHKEPPTAILVSQRMEKPAARKSWSAGSPIAELSPSRKPHAPDSRQEPPHVTSQNETESNAIHSLRSPSKRRAPVDEQEERPRKLVQHSPDFASSLQHVRMGRGEARARGSLQKQERRTEHDVEGRTLDKGQKSSQGLLDATSTVISQQEAMRFLIESLREPMKNARPLFNEPYKSERQLRWLKQEVDKLREEKKLLDAALGASETLLQETHEELQLCHRRHEVLSKKLRLFTELGSQEAETGSDAEFLAADDESRQLVDGVLGRASSALKQSQEKVEQSEREHRAARDAMESTRLKRDRLQITLAETEREVQVAKQEVDLGREKRKLAGLVEEYQSLLFRRPQ